MSTGEKQYGLVDPKAAKKITASDVFGNESDSDSDHGCDWMKKHGQKEEKTLKRQTKLEMQRALQQDPTVYQYDEIYDTMQRKEETEASKAPVDRKPKYIQALMKSADNRKKENERRLERQIQKEREAEGDMFKDKEEFITSSYKQKLEEFKKAEEEERKMEYIESIMDVSKQQDLGGFYRNLYKETVAKENNGESIENNAEPDSKDMEAVKTEKKTSDEPKPERHYRKRSNSECNDTMEKKSTHNSSSSSSDSDSSSDSSSTSSSSEDEEKNENKQNESKPKERNESLEDGDSGKPMDKIRKDDKSVESRKSESGGDKKVDGKKTDGKDDKSSTRYQSTRSSKADDKGRRDRSYRSSNYNDRDVSSRSHNRQREDRSYRDRERDRERDRDRSRRDDRRIRDGRDRRRSDSRRRRRSRSRSSDGRRGREKSRERRSERSRSRRRSHRDRDGDVQNATEEQKKKAVKDTGDGVAKTDGDKKEAEEEIRSKPSIWEKRTVGAVLEAALERYYQRKSARGS